MHGYVVAASADAASAGTGCAENTDCSGVLQVSKPGYQLLGSAHVGA